MAGLRLPRQWPTPVNRRLLRAQRELHGVCDEIVARRRAAGERRQDMLGLLLDARDEGRSLTDAEVRDQVLIFLLAGHETTSTALTYALHLLGRHPDAQRRVRAEVAAVTGDGAVSRAARRRRSTYTTMVLKETMRLYPSAPFLGRRAVEDDEIRGYRIPAGAEVVRGALGHPPPSALLGPAAPLPPASASPGAGEGPAPLRLVPVRRRAAGLHRTALLDARVGDRPRDAGPRVRLRRAARRAAAHQPHHAAPVGPSSARSRPGRPPSVETPIRSGIEKRRRAGRS